MLSFKVNGLTKPLLLNFRTSNRKWSSSCCTQRTQWYSPQSASFLHIDVKVASQLSNENIFLFQTGDGTISVRNEGSQSHQPIAHNNEFLDEVVFEQNVNSELFLFKYYISIELDEIRNLCDTPSVHFTVQPAAQRDDGEN